MFRIKKSSKSKNSAKKLKKDDSSKNDSSKKEEKESNLPQPVCQTEDDIPDKTELASPENSRDGFDSQTTHLAPETKKLADDNLWTQSDQVLMRCLLEVYQGNFCIIAKCMKNKTCKQVINLMLQYEKFNRK